MQGQELAAPVVTFRLAAALETYEAGLRTLAQGWADADLHRRLQQEFRQLRLWCAALPPLSVAWVAVLVSRARLLQAPFGQPAPAAALLHEHLAAVESLRVRCLRMMGAQAAVAPA